MIVRKATLILLLVFLPKILLSQSIEIGKWLGEWECVYQMDSKNLKEHLLIEEIHKRNFIHFAISGGQLEDSTLEFKYATDMYLTLNFEKHKFEGFWIDDHGFNGMMQLNGEMTGENMLTIEGDSPLLTSKTMLQLKDDGKLYRISIIKLKETGKVTSTDATFTKNK